MAIAAPVAGARILTSDVAAFYNLLKGVSGSGESLTLIYNATGSLIFQPSSDPATGTELIQIKNNAGTVQMALSSDGKVYAADGTAPLPGVTWEQDKDTGVYRITANTLGFSVGGAEKMRLDATGLSLDAGVTYINRDMGDQVGRWTYRWNGKLGFESAVTGTGVNVVPTTASNISYAQLSTGATSGSTASGRLIMGAFGAGALGVGKLRLLKILGAWGNIDANTNSWLYLTDESATAQPSNTARHLGIRQAGAVINFSTGDNATEQVTDISAFITAATMTQVDITYDGTTARCYVGGTLRATHVTNVPSSVNASQVFRWYITNTTAAGKAFYFDVIEAVFAD